MDCQLNVTVSIRDDQGKFFNINNDDLICKVLTDHVRYGLYPDSAGPHLHVEFAPVED